LLTDAEHDALVNEREKILWLARRAAFGLAPGELEQLEAGGSAAYLERLLEPDRANVPEAPDPFTDVVDPSDPQDNRTRVEMIQKFTYAWIDHMVTTPRRLDEMMTWFWHDHFAVQSSVVRSGRLMADHIDGLRRHALGNFRTMIREVTTNAAMLIYLDGARNTNRAPNENFGRELLELYTMGIGNYTEADVRAAAVALTGWQVLLRDGARVVFNPRLHETRPQTLLGRTVGDVDSVVDTAVDHPATAPFIARKVARFFLGPDVDDALVDRFASTFREARYEIRPLVREVLQAGLDGHGGPIVRSPLVWWVATRRATGVAPDPRVVVRSLDAAGQVPGNPPNVGGWPGMTAWLGASPTAMRASLATVAAEAASASAPAIDAAARRDHVRLARLLNVAQGFAPSTVDAIDRMGDCGTTPGVGALTVALASPDVLIG
jgi:uncharacterized protein (DUF1800 family)